MREKRQAEGVERLLRQVEAGAAVVVVVGSALTHAAEQRARTSSFSARRLAQSSSSRLANALQRSAIWWPRLSQHSTSDGRDSSAQQHAACALPRRQTLAAHAPAAARRTARPLRLGHEHGRPQSGRAPRCAPVARPVACRDHPQTHWRVDLQQVLGPRRPEREQVRTRCYPSLRVVPP